MLFLYEMSSRSDRPSLPALSGVARRADGLAEREVCPPNAPSIGMLMDLAAQSVADGRYTTCLAIYPTGNHGGNDFINIFPHAQDHRKDGGTHDDVAPFVVNQHKNGLLTPWGYNATHGVPQLTVEDYVTSRYILTGLCGEEWVVDGLKNRHGHQVCHPLARGGIAASDCRSR